MARVVVIDELGMWGATLAADLESRGCDAVAFTTLDAYLYTLRQKALAHVLCDVDAIVLALAGQGAAAVRYEIAIERLTKAFAAIGRRIPAIIFAGIGVDSSFVPIAAEIHAAFESFLRPDQIVKKIEHAASSRAGDKSDLPEFYGEHS